MLLQCSFNDGSPETILEETFLFADFEVNSAEFSTFAICIEIIICKYIYYNVWRKLFVSRYVCSDGFNNIPS